MSAPTTTPTRSRRLPRWAQHLIIWGGTLLCVLIIAGWVLWTWLPVWGIARFRLWITTSDMPTAEGLPKDVAEILELPAVTRVPDQIARLTDHYRGLDADLRKLQQAFATASRPLPADEKLVELERALTRATRPVLTDPALVQLRQDVALSARQRESDRLTSAQDLAWALINTPSFLFNR